MKLVPRSIGVALIGLAGLTGTASAGGLTPGNGNAITLPTVLPPSVRDHLLSATDSLGLDALGQKFGVKDGHLDFFSMRPQDGGDFKPLLRGGFGEGGLKLQLKW